MSIFICKSRRFHSVVLRLISLCLSASDDATPNEIKAQSPALNRPWPVPPGPGRRSAVTDEPHNMLLAINPTQLIQDKTCDPAPGNTQNGFSLWRQTRFILSHHRFCNRKWHHVPCNQPISRRNESAVHHNAVMQQIMRQTTGMAKLELYSHVNAVSKQAGRGSLLSALFVWISAHFLRLLRSPTTQVHSGKGRSIGKKRKPKKEKEDEEK